MIKFSGNILDENRAEQYFNSGIWTKETMVDILENSVNQHPELTHKDADREISYRELWQEVEAFAASLFEMGIRKGDKVAIQLPSSLDYVVAVFGIARIGATGVSLQVDLGKQALIQSLVRSEAKALIVVESYRGQSLFQTALEVKNEVPYLQHIIIQGNISHIEEDVLSFTALRSTDTSLSEVELMTNHPDPLDAFLIVFTSGTTGSPKGVVHLHANYIWAARAYAKNFGYKPGQGVLDLAPISHQTGMLAGIIMTIVSCGRILLLDRFSAKRALKWIEDERPSFLVGAPPHVIHVANASNLKTADTSSVNLFIYAGAPVPSTVLESLQSNAGIKVGAMFGWSEGLVATATHPDDPLEAINSTVGHVIPGIEVRLVDHEGNEVQPGQPGEMWSRGPNFCAGYFENEAAAGQQWDHEGWFHSGDLLQQDENGRYVFISRADDIINRGGTKIDPKTLEEVLAAHQDIERVTVVGAPHDTLGQQTVACIVLKDHAQAFTIPEIRGFLAENGLAKFQYPDQLKFLSKLPLTHSGKIKNKELRHWLQSELENSKKAQ